MAQGPKVMSKRLRTSPPPGHQLARTQIVRASTSRMGEGSRSYLHCHCNLCCPRISSLCGWKTWAGMSTGDEIFTRGQSNATNDAVFPDSKLCERSGPMSLTVYSADHRRRFETKEQSWKHKTTAVSFHRGFKHDWRCSIKYHVESIQIGERSR